jgi:hypothetical protein
MPKRSRKRPRDINSLAAFIVKATTEESPVATAPPKSAAAVELGRKGGKIGGKARAANMTPEERTEAAKKAAEARWGKR